ncbi:hexuronate transporter [Oxobacter pfennigii]|uniref:Hexuronate transporter n=1 Tax=Oxobacter pfennigii TaxID=36849 RepID=A0A0P8WJN7_9CLOT|nr:MFS transporter [Oxobacter pfennigii]KPU42375.1 hexuronate transporter [Oxobacter pfennigii]
MEEKKAINMNEDKTTWYSWVIAILCLLIFAANFNARNVWTVSITKAAPDLGITMAQAGGMMSAFYVGYVVSNFFSGIIIDNIGTKVTLALATILTGVFTWVIPYSSNYWVILILRVLAGIASGPFFAGMTKMNLGWFSSKTRATAFAIIMSGASLSGVFNGAIFAPMVNNQGWKYAFVVASISTIILGVIFFFLAKERGLAKAVKKPGGSLTAEEKAANMKGAMDILKSKQFVLGTIVSTIGVATMNGLNTFTIPFLMTNYSLSLPVAGSITAAAAGIMLFIPTLGGIATDIINDRKHTCLFTQVMNVIGTIALLLTSNVSILWGIMMARGVIGLFGNNNNVMQTERSKGPYAGTVLGIYNAISQLGSVIMPVLLGVILDMTQNYAAVLLTVAGFQAVGAICVWMQRDPISKQKPAAAAKAS